MIPKYKNVNFYRVSFDDGRTNFKKLLMPIGALSFLLSDLTLGFSYYVSHLGYNGEYFILATYFGGQGLIALSIS